MKDAKKSSKVKASSGNYRIWPVTDKDGQIYAWHGRGEIFHESTDFADASELAGQLGDRMPVAILRISGSTSLRAKQDKALLVRAVLGFADTAHALTKNMGFSQHRT